MILATVFQYLRALRHDPTRIVMLVFDAACNAFECARRAIHPTLLRLLEEYPETVRLVFKHNPLSIHPDAALAHRASLAADRQERFWEMHDKIFATSRDLSRSTLIEHARDLDLDVAQFTRDLDSEELIALLDREVAEANRLGVTGTPTFFINGRIVSGAQPYENFTALIERELARVGSRRPPTTPRSARCERGGPGSRRHERSAGAASGAS